jgi:hypothetical protein
MRDTRIVDEHIQPSESLHYRVHGPVTGRLIRHIKDKPETIRPFSSKLIAQCLHTLSVKVRKAHPGPGHGETTTQGPADTACRSGYDNHFVSEIPLGFHNSIFLKWLHPGIACIYKD